MLRGYPCNTKMKIFKISKIFNLFYILNPNSALYILCINYIIDYCRQCNVIKRLITM